MNKGRLIATVTLSLMLSIALAQTSDAFGGRGGRGGFGGRPSGFHQPGFKGGGGFKGGFNRTFPGFGPGFGAFPGFGFSPGVGAFPGFGFGFGGFNHGFKGNTGFGWFAPWGSTTVYYPYGNGSPEPVNYPTTYAPVYNAPAVYTPQMGSSIAVTPAPPAPKSPSVVVFSGGRYELQGDGVTTPYQWVWIPSPTTVPPVPPPPPLAPELAPGGQQPSAGAQPAPRSQLYRWTDEQGVVHWTNRADAVPAKYRKDAKYDPA
jgi:Domain of unknown function (DUF4124)